MLFSFPAGTKMFQFPALASIIDGCYLFKVTGCPIRKFTDQGLFAPPRDLSQLITSFIASESQGIRHAPLFTFIITYTLCITTERMIYTFSSFGFNQIFIFSLLHHVKDLLCEGYGVGPLFRGRHSCFASPASCDNYLSIIILYLFKQTRL